MYQCFTDRARKVMQLANQEAQRLNHEYIGTEHILLGLVSEGSGVAAHVLKNLDINPRKIRKQIETIVQSGPDTVTVGQWPQTPRAKKVIEHAVEEARHLNHNYVGTEHLLLGLLREQDTVAGQVLMNLGLKLEDVRDEIFNFLGHDPDAVKRNEQTLGHVEQSPDKVKQTREREQALETLLKLPPEVLKQVVELAQQILDLQPEVQKQVVDLARQIARLNDGKEAAVAEQDFAKAAHLRDQADKLKKQMQRIFRQAQ